MGNADPSLLYFNSVDIYIFSVKKREKKRVRAFGVEGSQKGGAMEKKLPFTSNRS